MKKLFLFMFIFFAITIFLSAQDDVFENDYRIFFKDKIIDMRNLSVTKIETENHRDIISFHKDYIALYNYTTKKLSAIDNQTLKKQWEIKLKKTIYKMKIDENSIYCIEENGLVFINRKSGKIENEYTLLKDDYVRDINLSSNVIAILTSNHKLIFLNKSNFKEIKGISFDTKQYSNFYSNILHLGKKDNFLIYLNLETEFHIICFDEKAKIVWEKKITHTHIEKEGNTYHYKPYLSLIHSDERYILFSTNVFYPEFEKTIIFDSFTGDIISDLNIKTMSFLKKDDKIVSLLKLEELKEFKDGKNLLISMLDTITGKKLWETNAYSHSNELIPLLCEDKLVLALYSRGFSGFSLICLDYITGKLLWKENTLQVPVIMSSYFNIIYLKKYEDKVVLLKAENYDYEFQVFLVEDGKKIFSDSKEFLL